MKEQSEGKLFRLVYVVLFYLVFSISEFILLCIAVVQTILNILTDEPSETLREFSASLAIYVKQIVLYIGFVSDEKPFPFADWPNPGFDSSVENPVSDSSDIANKEERG